MLAAALLIALHGPDFAAARARLDALNAQEAALSQRIGKNREEQARLLSALQAARRNPPPALLVSPQSAKDAVRAAILMRAIQPELQRRAKALSDQSLALAKLRREAAEASSSLFAAESAAADRSGPPARRAVAKLDATPPSPTPLTPLRPPVTGDVVRRYGEAWPGRGRSEGWSWKTAPGAAVASPSDGRVEFAGVLRNWGLVIVLQRADGWRTVLSGLQSADLAPARWCAPARPSGACRNRRTPDPELYLEFRRGSDPVDPGPYILRPRAASPAT